ncbi:hypothetical protein SAMN02745116_01811 [Pilibacter termitis]|uniref:Uncharacterized protein n=1 Tax=Pilibacter termitis TaxID=263852 RepID=A0A1T4PJ28_9ENTE|nr:hypothetical protein SAMN02745116_01811 [Pilibacter termitis]
MTKKLKLSFIALDIYTVLLLNLFVMKMKTSSLVFPILIIFIHLFVFIAVILANKRVIQVYYIVGKSKKREWTENFCVDFFSLFLSTIVFNGMFAIFLRESHLFILCLLSFLLITLKNMYLFLFLRRIV